MAEHSLDGRTALGARFCQSCGSPFAWWADYGTEADGSPSRDYCRLCYARGCFRFDCSMEDMLQVASARLACATGMPVARAQGLLGRLLPGLARWRRPARIA
jgi:hypothetical protein